MGEAFGKYPQPGSLWRTDEEAVPELDSAFTAVVLSRARKRVIYRDLLFVCLEGFWSIMRGFLNAPAKTEAN